MILLVNAPCYVDCHLTTQTQLWAVCRKVMTAHAFSNSLPALDANHDIATSAFHKHFGFRLFFLSSSLFLIRIITAASWWDQPAFSSSRVFFLPDDLAGVRLGIALVAASLCTTSPFLYYRPSHCQIPHRDQNTSLLWVSLTYM